MDLAGTYVALYESIRKRVDNKGIAELVFREAAADYRLGRLYSNLALLTGELMRGYQMGLAEYLGVPSWPGFGRGRESDLVKLVESEGEPRQKKAA